MRSISIAIPDSSLSDEQTKRDKSIKTGQFARACSIFRVSRIYVYHDALSQFEKEDPGLLTTVLRYLDTPQYLRKALYPKMSQLEYAGILHPIKAPHHKPQQDIRQIKKGDIRAGIVVKVKGNLFVEAGLGSLIAFDGQGFEGKRINIVFVSEYPNIRAREASEGDIKEYWGYEVKEVPSLSKLLSSIDNSSTITILTSRKGTFFRNIQTKIEQRSEGAPNFLVVFGAPKHGLQDILAKEGANAASNPNEFLVNMFPGQATETVRLEEAVLGSLAILNTTIGGSR